MSAIDIYGEKSRLSRIGSDEFWRMIQEHYAHERPLKWKYLAMLALRENAGWPLDTIGLVFQHRKGHVVRCLERVKQELQDRFQASPEFLSFLNAQSFDDDLES